MYAWRNLQSKSIVAAFMNMRAHPTHKTEENSPKRLSAKKLTPTKATPTDSHSA